MYLRGVVHEACPVCFGVLRLALPLHAAEVPVDARASARAEVQRLVEGFRQALLKKDGDAVRGMFLPDGSWFRVLDTTSLTAVRVKRLETKQFTPGSFEVREIAGIYASGVRGDLR